MRVFYTSPLRQRLLAALAIMMTGTVCRPSWADDVGTGFTYQGRLHQDAEPFDGEADLAFRLYDAPAGGNQIGPELTAPGFNIEEGLFTIDLDFGNGAFGTDARWLEIAVDDTTLSPRQPVMAAPVAQFALAGNDSHWSVDGSATYYNDGHVGIGTANPVTPLEVAGTIRSSGADGGTFQARNPDNENAMVALSWLNDVPRIRIGGNGAGANGGLDIQRIGDQSLFRIHGDGNVGVGIAEPERTLHLHRPSASILLEGASGSSSYLRFVRSGVDSDDAQNYIALGSSDGSLVTRVGGDDRMRILANGNIGIGTNSPETRLHVTESSSDNAILGENSGSAAGVFGHNTQTTGITSGVVGRSDSTGGRGVFGWATAGGGNNAGVLGQSDSSNGGRGVRGYNSSTFGTNYGVWGETNSSSGFDFYAAGAGTDYGSSSSRRWKSNIRNIGDPLGKVAQLRGVYYDWNPDHGGHHDVGMIAEEVGEVLPEIVKYEENGIDAIGMDYSKLTPLLVEALNALRDEKDAEIAQLHAEKDAEIEALNRRVERLEAIITAAMDGEEVIR